MPPLGKENFVAACEAIDKVFDHKGKFVKTGPGIYFYDLDLLAGHKQIAQDASFHRMPLDAGNLTYARGEHALYIREGSNDFKIRADNPERPRTIADFQGFAEGTGIDIR